MICYVLSNDEGTVLAVYGSALREEALGRWRELSAIGSVHWHACKFLDHAEKPHVGQSISMRGHTEVGCNACKVHA